MHNNLNKQRLDKIINNMKDVVVKSKDEIFFISEEAHREYNSLKKELRETKERVKECIRLGDKLGLKVRNYRKKLSYVSRKFDKYSEEEIRSVYDKTHRLQTEHAVLIQDEKTLRQKRDDLERRIKRLKKTIEHAENLGQKISVILTYLNDDFEAVSQAIKSAKEKQQFGLKIIE